MLRRLFIIVLAAILVSGCSSCVDTVFGGGDGDGDGANNGNNANNANNANNQNNGGGNNGTSDRPTWEYCRGVSSATLELVETDGLEDAFSDVELSFTRAYYHPSTGAIRISMLFSDSDDLEDAGDHRSLFVSFLGTYDDSGTIEVDSPAGAPVSHLVLANPELGDVLGVDEPWYEIREATITYDVDTAEVGSSISGDFEFVLGARCFAHDGTVTYRGAFDTTLTSIYDRDDDPCTSDEIGGEWNAFDQVGELEIIADGRLVQWDQYNVHVDQNGRFSIFAVGGEDDRFQISLEDAMLGDNTVPLVNAGHDDCSYVGQNAGPVTLGTGNGGDLQMGPTEGSFEMTLQGAGEGCPDEAEWTGEFTFGICKDR